MNSKTVLERIKTMLSTDTVEVEFAYAELPDGRILESESFDVGEEVFVISDNDQRLPAPDGEHVLTLKGEEGEEVKFEIEVDNGIITEREPVVETEDVVEDEEAEEMAEEETSEEMAEDEIEDTEEEEDIDINLADVAKQVEDMSYRIEELEKKIDELQEDTEEAVEEEMEEEVEEELSETKLDGAPTESKKRNFNKQSKTASPQSLFLSKLYNN